MFVLCNMKINKHIWYISLQHPSTSDQHTGWPPLHIKWHGHGTTSLPQFGDRLWTQPSTCCSHCTLHTIHTIWVDTE